MARLVTVGLNAPPEFPADLYNKLHQRLELYTGATGEPWTQWMGAWNAVAYRYFAARDYDRAFSGSIVIHGDAPPAAERYRQERALYGFFVNALSVLESFAYAAFAFGAMAKPSKFLLARPSQLRAITIERTRDLFAANFPNTRLTGALQHLTAPTRRRYIELGAIRNVLAHRAAPGRGIYRSAGAPRKDPPPVIRLSDHGVKDLVLDPGTTGSRMHWLHQQLPTLIGGLDELAKSLGAGDPG